VREKQRAEKEGLVEPIFNFLGHTAGWLDGAVAFSGDGWPVALIEGGAVFVAKNGHYVGHFHEDVFRDRLGWKRFVSGREAHWPWKTCR